jgi:hypothetical protein
LDELTIESWINWITKVYAAEPGAWYKLSYARRGQGKWCEPCDDKSVAGLINITSSTAV